MNYAGLRDLSILAHCYCYPSTRTTFAILIEEMLAHPIVPQHFCLIALCCLLTYFQSTLFSFQGADLPTLFKVRLKHSAFSLNASIQSRIYISWKLLSKLSLPSFFLERKKVVGPSGLEPPTSRLSVARSSQLSYGPILVEIIGLEPMTPCLQSRCSPS